MPFLYLIKCGKSYTIIGQMFALKFAFKNIISRKSSIVIVLFIAFSIAIFVMANAVFDGTRTGIEKTFSNNFTGDIVIRPKAQFPMSLFGDETPITGELSELPELIPYTELIKYVKSNELVDKSVPQITGQAALRVNNKNVLAYFFGVDGDEYVDLMGGIKILEGRPYFNGENSIMLSKNMIEKISRECGQRLSVGDTVQLASFNGTSFGLRAAVLSAIYDYSVNNDLQDKIVLIAPEILRQLIGLGSTEIDPALFTKENSDLLDILQEGSIDDLFGEADDFVLEETFSTDAAAAESVQETHSENAETIWNYIVCSASKGVSPNHAIKKMNSDFKKFEWPFQAVGWRAAAGMSAQYIHWIRLIFNIGLLIVVATGYIIVNNTLVVAALDRTTETGALRAIGAGRRFIAGEYLLETLMLTITAGVLGCILGFVGNAVVSGGGITFTNTYLVQLFGGETLRTAVSAHNIIWGMVLSLVLAFVAWIYPVQIALSTSPVAAMEAVR